MEKWKTLSVTMRSWAIVNLVALAAVLLLPFSRPATLKVFAVFKVSAVVLLALLLVEYTLRRLQGAKGSAVVVNAALVVLMFCVWFMIAAVTF